MLPASSVSIDDSLWPLRVVRFVGTASPRQFEHYLEETTACLRRREQYISITDLTQGGPSTAEHRQRLVRWMHQYEPLMREVLLGTAFVINSPFMRLAVSAVTHLKPLPIPYLIAAQELEASAWAGACLEEQGLRLAAERVRSHYGLPTRGYVLDRVSSA
ncbi:hypothetical protein [Vitiosangium sp. GDMCC 1.1324]|uniref:hypothetical protein n=1 Tax=Vitiosangium sp. (strain GDMCC 1.1324) TaxID=2138576 RepID=UPI000D344BAB|nr:hypothetical protein [Vitiosangium sp. GDMCC 1.1324]PTL82124.1 hypothetical protein DAT35_20195 [Vitiosangium sp. GDMCC 1.1324]